MVLSISPFKAWCYETIFFQHRFDQEYYLCTQNFKQVPYGFQAHSVKTGIIKHMWLNITFYLFIRTVIPKCERFFIIEMVFSPLLFNN